MAGILADAREKGRMGRIDLLEALDSIDQTLVAQNSPPTTLTLIGGAAVILLGHQGRFTADIDVWVPGSTFRETCLHRASLEAGLQYDPHHEESHQLFLQMVEPGIVQLPPARRWISRASTEWQGGNLRVLVPPPALLCAMKMRRAEKNDLHDAAFLLGTGRCTLGQVALEVEGLPESVRETARENLVLLEVFTARAPALRQGPRPVPTLAPEEMRL